MRVREPLFDLVAPTGVQTAASLCGLQHRLEVRGARIYLYRAVDRDGNLIGAMLSEMRYMRAPKAFLCSMRAVMGLQLNGVTIAPVRGAIHCYFEMGN